MKTEKQLKRSIEEVETLSAADLRIRFAELYGADCVCPNSTQILRDRIVYRLQEIYYGGICDADRMILKELTTHQNERTVKNIINRKYLSPGVRLIRQWDGVNHEVVVRGEKAFEYGGQIFKSLSGVARAITGTNWNGNVFFGVANGKNNRKVCRVLPKIGGRRAGARL